MLHRFYIPKYSNTTICRTCGAYEHVVGADSECLAARHPDPEINKLYKARRKACLEADWAGTSYKRSNGWASSEAIAAELTRLDPKGDWYFEGDRHDGRGWRVERTTED